MTPSPKAFAGCLMARWRPEFKIGVAKQLRACIFRGVEKAKSEILILLAIIHATPQLRAGIALVIAILPPGSVQPTDIGAALEYNDRSRAPQKQLCDPQRLRGILCKPRYRT